MSQCVPSWDLDDTPNSSRLTFPPYATPPNISTLDYEVAELTWENGQLAMHGLGPPRALGKSPPFSTITATKYNNNTTTTWDKPRAGDTLESIVNQATTNNKIALEAVDLVPWFDHHRATAAAAAPASPLAMDALVPSSSAAHKRSVVRESSRHVPDPTPKLGVASNGGGGCSTRVESCSGDATIERGKTEGKLEGGGGRGAKRARAARVPTSLGEQSASASATFGGDSRQVTLDTCDLELDAGFGSTSLGSSQDNTTAGNPSPSYTKPTTVDDHDSVAHSRPQRETGFEEDKKKGQNGKSSVSTKRSRAAAIHNQSERKRRDKINQKMKTLQKLVPNSSKTDKASMLDEVIEYIKQLQAQVQMMSRLNMPHMMIPMTLQQQLQMSLMTRMSMGMGMGLMDMNPIAHHHRNLAAIPPILNPAATFMPMASWDGTSDRLPPSSAAVLPDPLSAFLACQTQQRMDAYNRIASLYQQVHQGEPPVSASKT